MGGNKPIVTFFLLLKNRNNPKTSKTKTISSIFSIVNKQSKTGLIGSISQFDSVQIGLIELEPKKTTAFKKRSNEYF